MSHRDGVRGQRERLAREVLNRQHSDVATINARQTVQVPVQGLTPEQMYSNFEEWMKMCTDNKVNATNSWNFALIDYFHEMTFIREGDSINFQKASCTLDGCVKIYTSRVDSVASETGKLLSGLADSARDNGNGLDEDEEDELHNTETSRKRTRRGNRSETLLKDFSSIALKKFDLDFAVDPLFKKTSADFDEGGARGLLLNHLGIDRDYRIIFDASDSGTTEKEHGTDLNDVPDRPEEMEEQQNEEEAEDSTDSGDSSSSDSENEDEDEKMEDANAVPEESTTNETAGTENEIGKEDELTTEQAQTNHDAMDVDESQAQEESQVTPLQNRDDEDSQGTSVEISRLRAKIPSFEILSELQICPTLQTYEFFTEGDAAMPSLGQQDDHQEPGSNNDDLPQQNDIEDQGFDDDFGADFDFNDDGPILDGIDAVPFDDGDNGLDNLDVDTEDDKENTSPSDPDNFLSILANGENNELFSYFDTTFAKNWAGPEHWKLRKTIVKEKEKPVMNDQEGPNEGEEDQGGRKTARAAFTISFLEGDDVNEDDLFATDKRTKTTLGAVKDNAQLSSHFLPDDIHFSSKSLLKLFSKPTFSIQNPKKSNPVPQNETESTPEQRESPPEDYDAGFDDDFGYAEPDANYWANQPELNPEAKDTQEVAATQADETVITGYDDTSFYQDTIYDPYDDAANATLYGDALVTNHQPKKTKPLYVNYARTAKRVDVKRLKENLWASLEKQKDADTSAYTELVEGTQRFTDVLRRLRNRYSEKTFKDISVPFCFICLLHLANERNLTIARGGEAEDPDDFVLGDTMMDEDFLNEVTIVQN